MSNIADIAKVVLESETLDNDQKMTLLQSMFNSNKIENNNQTNETPDDGTFKLTIQKRSDHGHGKGSGKYVFGHRKWTKEDRIEFFTILVEQFGPHKDWLGTSLPDATTDMENVWKQLSKRYDRTPHALKAQLIEATSPTREDISGRKNKGTMRVKDAAYEAGFIDTETANS